MDRNMAAKVLNANLSGEKEKFTGNRLYSGGWYLSVDTGDETATLDGEFTADDLEAIASWMRDSEGVFDEKVEL